MKPNNHILHVIR